MTSQRVSPRDDLQRPLRGVTFHTVRHTHITTLLQRVGKAGAKAVSRRAGRANLSTTLEVYQAVFEEDDRALGDLSAGLFNRKLSVLSKSLTTQHSSPAPWLIAP